MNEKGNTIPSDLEGWIDKLITIYDGKIDGANASRIWSRVTVHGSAVGEAFRENRFSDLVQHLGQSLGWELIFFGLARKKVWPALVIPFEKEDWDGLKYPSKKNYGPISSFGDVVHYHYPEMCPHCLGYICNCAPSRREEGSKRLESMIRQRWLTKGKIDQHWGEVEQRFLDLYSHDDIRKSYSEIGFHFLEEVGEVTNAIDMIGYRPEMANKNYDSPTTGNWYGQLIEELADVVSWATSMVRRIRLDLQNYCGLCETEPSDSQLRQYFSLAWILEKTYIQDGIFKCPTCNEFSCKKECIEL